MLNIYEIEIAYDSLGIHVYSETVLSRSGQVVVEYAIRKASNYEYPESIKVDTIFCLAELKLAANDKNLFHHDVANQSRNTIFEWRKGYDSPTGIVRIEKITAKELFEQVKDNKFVLVP